MLNAKYVEQSKYIIDGYHEFDIYSFSTINCDNRKATNQDQINVHSMTNISIY